MGAACSSGARAQAFPLPPDTSARPPPPIRETVHAQPPSPRAFEAWSARSSITNSDTVAEVWGGRRPGTPLQTPESPLSPRLHGRRGALCSLSAPNVETLRRTPSPCALPGSTSVPVLGWTRLTVKVRARSVRTSTHQRIAYVYTGGSLQDGIAGEIFEGVAVPLDATRDALPPPPPPPPLVYLTCGALPPVVLHETVAMAHTIACTALMPPCVVEPLCVLWGPNHLPLHWTPRVETT